MELQRPALGSSSDAMSGADAPTCKSNLCRTELDASDPPPEEAMHGSCFGHGA